MTKLTWGINALNHDASLSVVDNGGNILFAAHSERYSRVKNDSRLCWPLIHEAIKFGVPSEIVWSDRPLHKTTRQMYSGQWEDVFDRPMHQLREFRLHKLPIHFVGHHESHAAGGFWTSGFADAAVIVVDAIGEWDTISVWHATMTHPYMKRIAVSRYPHSLGLLYSAFTQRLGLKPNEEEYIMMGMAAYGQPKYATQIMEEFIEDWGPLWMKLKRNVHRGIKDWMPNLKSSEYVHVAASVQHLTEMYLIDLCRTVRGRIDSPNLVFSGGVALNCVANEKIARSGVFDRMWVLPNPGDAGNSLGAVAAHHQKDTLRRHLLRWKTPYLGTAIGDPESVNVRSVVDAIINEKVVGVANGRAEFGPRALGNRSLLADPRGRSTKDWVNDIKKRERFRPFAPVIMEEHAAAYFDMPVASSPYMQFTAPCLRAESFPAITHVDKTSRVQTVNYHQNPLLYSILTEFFNRTGCPMLLNTSLNIKGEPLVNSVEDARRFQEKHRISIF